MSLVAIMVASLLAIDGILVDDGTPLMTKALTAAHRCADTRKPIRLVVKSRRRLVRDAMCAYLTTRPEYEVVGHSGAIDALAELCQLRRPDVALIDTIDLDRHAIEGLLRVRAAAPRVELVVTYSQASPEALRSAVSAGITTLLPGSRGLDAVLRQVRERAPTAGRQRPDGVALTDSDVAVLSLTSSGHSVQEIAALLGVSPRTVENHNRRLYVKLNVRNSTHAVARAMSLGLVDAPGLDGRVRQGEPGHKPLAVVRGSTGTGLEAVQQALKNAALPFVRIRVMTSVDREGWAEWHRPIVTILIDPTHDDWVMQSGFGWPTIVVLSQAPDLPTFIDMLLRGAHALLSLDDVADLAAVVPAVARGYLTLDATHLDDIAGWMTARLATGSPAVPALTPRESDVLGALASGNTIQQTARSLGIAPKTVENTQARLYRKLGARNGKEALTIAHRLGLLEPPPA